MNRNCMSIPNQWRPRLKAPLIVAPMFLISGVDLVVSCCKAGVIGTFPALNARTTEQLDEWLTQIKEQLKDGDYPPFGVNLIVHGSNPRLKADLEICAKHQVELIITSLGANTDIVKAVHSFGALNFHDITQIRHAKKAAESGADGLIAVAAGAGGHAGTLSPFALCEEIRLFWDKALILAGGLNSGKHLKALEYMGADLGYMGTRFIPTHESMAPEDYKNMICESEAKDIVYTPKVSGVPANFLAASLEKNKVLESETPHALSLKDEAKAWKDVWSAGHGVGSLKSIKPAQEIVQSIISEYV